MSPKELLYIEDALGHEQHIQQKCQVIASQLQDAQLKEFVSGLKNRHTSIFINS